jgi:hypothetical protein
MVIARKLDFLGMIEDSVSTLYDAKRPSTWNIHRHRSRIRMFHMLDLESSHMLQRQHPNFPPIVEAVVTLGRSAARRITRCAGEHSTGDYYELIKKNIL